jgi:hypothetical protein
MGIYDRKTKDEAILKSREMLGKMVTEWLEDGSSPCNYIRTDGLGNELARVDVWCGGFQDSHKPVIVGWRAQIRNMLFHDVVVVSDFGKGQKAKKAAIKEAKRLADEALAKLRHDELLDDHPLSLIAS